MAEKGGSGGRGRMPGGDLLACTFCGRSQSEVRKLVAGPSAFICDSCIGLAEDVVNSGSAADTPLGPVRAVPTQERQACSFCGKPRYRVAGLAAISAQTRGRYPEPASICTECIDLCNEILAKEPPL